MAEREEITLDVLISHITDCLSEMDGDDIVQVANDVLSGTYTYLEDEMVLVEKEIAQ